jgi:hypothetical protein
MFTADIKAKGGLVFVLEWACLGRTVFAKRMPITTALPIRGPAFRRCIEIQRTRLLYNPKAFPQIPP